MRLEEVQRAFEDKEREAREKERRYERELEELVELPGERTYANTLGALEDHFWARFCDLAGVPQLKQDQFPEGDARESQFSLMEEVFRKRTRQEWVDLFFANDIPGGPVNTMSEAFDDPHMRARQMLLHVDHPIEGRIPQLGFPVKFSGTPASINSPPPTLGQHTGDVLSGLGYDAARIASLAQNGTT
jgi:crotonobetainyl-CoA:carnitine CoA-transferase CaiB-like acyl-CoA transferase